MKPSLTRRDFLRRLVPSWLTATNLKISGIGMAVFLVVSCGFASLRELGVLGIFKLLGIAVAVVLALWAVARITAAFVALSRRFPPSLSALAAVLGESLNFVITASLGAYLYVRWRNGEDLTGIVIFLVVTLAVRFRDEWEKRAALALRTGAADELLRHSEPGGRGR